MKLTGTQTLETSRLILRQFRVEDAEAMYRNWASDPEVTRYLTWPPHPDAGITRMLLQDWVARYADGSSFNWAIVPKEEQQPVGGISVVRLDAEAGIAEIGYCLGRAFWGRGFMPEALRAVIDYLFDTAEVNRIVATHDARNPNSGRVMRKAGLRFEGVMRGAGRNNQGVCDDVVYGLLRTDRQPETKREKAEVTVRFAHEADIPRVNELRRQVKELHAAGKPEVFKPGFSPELADTIHEIFADERRQIAVAEVNGSVCGYAVLNHITRPENPFMHERDFLDIDEFGVDEQYRQIGVASELIRFIRAWAKEKGFRRLELNMWSFNRGALAFYEAAGFSTYRRYMEIHL